MRRVVVQLRWGKGSVSPGRASTASQVLHNLAEQGCVRGYSMEHSRGRTSFVYDATKTTGIVASIVELVEMLAIQDAVTVLVRGPKDRDLRRYRYVYGPRIDPSKLWRG